jgi:2-succinyl-5-enolpyruvyl-6-hydroxy-3-cyclohexene-1-carboxylate synthase
VINHYGDLFDPTRNAKSTLAIDVKIFCESMISQLKSKKFSRQKSDWLKDFIKAEEISNKVKSSLIERSKFLNESSIITDIFRSIPPGTNVFIGNSLPVRDLDNFLPNTSKRLTIHFNRGASGIDGITSTALGIAVGKKPTVLITGDLSFLHDLNALSIAVKYSIPITIVIINNNGGGIFNSLPIAQKVNQFREFFVTPHNLEFSGIVKSFGIKYKLITGRSHLKSHLIKSMNKNSLSVLEIQTNAVKSVDLRNKYFNEVKKKLNKEFLK